MVLVFIALGASTAITLTLSHPYPQGATPTGNWQSWFTLQADTSESSSAQQRLELLSQNQIDNLSQDAQPYIQASLFTQTVQLHNQHAQAHLAFVSPDFFHTLGIETSQRTLTGYQTIVSSSFAKHYKLTVGDTLYFANTKFTVIDIVAGFYGLDHATDIYVPIQLVEPLLYSDLPEQIRSWVVADLPLYFYATQNEEALQSTSLLDLHSANLYPIAGIQYQPEHAQTVAILNRYVFVATFFLASLFLLTDYGLTRYWFNQRQGDIALMATLGATRKQLFHYIVRLWLLPRAGLWLIIFACIPFASKQLLHQLDYANLPISTTFYIYTGILLLGIYLLITAFLLNKMRHLLHQLNQTLSRIKASTRRNSSQPYLFYSAGLLIVFMFVLSLFAASIKQLHHAMNQPMLMQTASLYAADFKLKPGIQVDMQTLNRRQQAIQHLKLHLGEQGIDLAATNLLPMSEPVLHGQVTTVADRSLTRTQADRAPRIPVAFTDLQYQELVAHALIQGHWPRSSHEVAVNEAFLRYFGIDDSSRSLPEIWLDGDALQVTAIVSDAYWLDPIATPQPMAWQIKPSFANNLLIQWSGTKNELQQIIKQQLQQLDIGIALHSLHTIDERKHQRLKTANMLLRVLLIVVTITFMMALGSLWVAIQSWLNLKRWTLTIHLALGATRRHLKQQLWYQLTWPLLACIPWSIAISLTGLYFLFPTIPFSQALGMTMITASMLIALVGALLSHSYAQLLRLEPSQLMKDAT